ncbi:MAG: hypothetical protein HY360_03280, partial [Verrucomicrobia bacterium]|nr:hypothetical protein [Verrucomicrobiota bacterium]
DGPDLKVKAVGQQSAAHAVALPVKYQEKFTVTGYFIPNEGDYAPSPKVISTLQVLPAVKRYYFVASDVQARQNFLKAMAIQGDGFLDNTHPENMRHVIAINTTLATLPDPLPNGTNDTWTFIDSHILLAPGGPKGCHNLPLVVGQSCAIVRVGQNCGGDGEVIPDQSTIDVQGFGQRVAMDNVANLPGFGGVYHIDILAASRAAALAIAGQRIVVLRNYFVPP